MIASMLDLKRRMRDIFRALDRNESVTIFYRGKEKAILSPLPKPANVQWPAPMSGANLMISAGLRRVHLPRDEFPAGLLDGLPLPGDPQAKVFGTGIRPTSRNIVGHSPPSVFSLHPTFTWTQVPGPGRNVKRDFTKNLV